MRLYILTTQNNLAITYKELGHIDQAMRLRQSVYSESLKLLTVEDGATLMAANNYADSLIDLQRLKEAKALLRRTIPVARRVLGKRDDLPLIMRNNYAEALYKDDDATLDDLREALTTLEDVERTARRVLGGAHPLTTEIEKSLREARAALSARETPSSGSA